VRIFRKFCDADDCTYVPERSSSVTFFERAEIKMRFLRMGTFANLITFLFPLLALAQVNSHETCQRPAIGSVVTEPEDLRSENGILKMELTVRSSVDAAGHVRYCYLAKDGSQAPNVRVKPGDWLILSLKNEIHVTPKAMAPSMAMSAPDNRVPPGSCTETDMTAASTNLHFHGLTVPPVCHQDDVLKTIIQPRDAPFEYRFQIPPDEPPGLYWYHPHVHGFTSPQVLGGASGC
jgi:FtsP/CotA-like multicopper oxidase with cupredoxin domain